MNFADRLSDGDFMTGNNPQLLPFKWRNALHGHLEVGLVVRLLGIPTGKRVLQVGSGSGIALTSLSRLCRPQVIVGIDIDQTLLGESVDRLRERRVHAHLVQADVKEMPFPDRLSDLVVDFGVCYHVKHPGDALIEIARVLDTYGRFVHETPLPNCLPIRSLIASACPGRRRRR